jgi:flagellin
MSGIVLSSSVRQNLLSLQSTADLLATTQNRLATGKKVNTALDNPTNFFTASALDNRASDISNLLDGIGNGVQVLQAANTGITSLQKLVDSAKSVANQALQATVGYSSKSSVSSAAIAGATASDLRGTVGAASAGTVTAGAFSAINVSGAATAATFDAGALGTVDLSGANTLTFTLNVDGTDHAVSLNNTITAVDNTQVTGAELVTAINASVGSNVASFTGGHLTFTSTTTGPTSSVTLSLAGGSQAANAGITNQAIVNGSAADSISFTVARDGAAAQTVTLSAQAVTTYNGTQGAVTANAAALTADDVARIANSQLNANVATVVSGALVFTSTTTGVNSSVTLSNVTNAGTPQGSTGITAASDSGAAGVAPLNGLTLTIGATGNGTATSITFGDGTGGTVKSLNDLNAQLAANNLFATFDSSTSRITITTTNEAASSTIGTIAGTAAGVGQAFNGLTGSAPVADAVAQATRADLVNQYNNILNQITTTAQDASYNGVNLLNGDQLKLTFNETGRSTLTIQGVIFNPAGLGLNSLTVGTDFIDNSSANSAITALNTASSTLRSQASAFGSNLSIVQIRQDFSKNLINVLQTGSSNLTLADTNEEAANSQALSTRQSIAVSALALANQSQQSVLQLLR